MHLLHDPVTDHPPCLVTGATGFIGRNLVSSLLVRGNEVRVIQRPGTSTGMPVEDIVADLSSREALIEAMRGIEVVYHLAGIGSPASAPEEYSQIIETNVTGTLNVLQAAAEAGVRRVVLASSASVYGRMSSGALREDMEPQPASVYGMSKLSAEQICTMIHRSTGIETVALRYFNVYGPDEDPEGQSPKLIPSLLRRIQSREPITLYGDGGQTRDYVHVDDVVKVTIQAGTADSIDHEILNVGSGQPVSVAEVVRVLSDHMGVTPRVIHQAPRPYEVDHSVADISRTAKILSYNPAVSLAQGARSLSETLQQRRVAVG